MRFFTLSFINLIICFQLFSQEEAKPKAIYFPEHPMRENVAVFVEKEAEFPGGATEMMKYLAKNLKLPEYELEQDHECITGKISVRFIVEEDGSVTSIQFKNYNPNCPEFYEEITKILLSMPKWVPAANEGKNAASYYYFPIYIKWS